MSPFTLSLFDQGRMQNVILHIYFILGVACLLNKINRKHVTVAVDGSVYRYHPFFHDLMTEKIKQLLNPELDVSTKYPNPFP